MIEVRLNANTSDEFLAIKPIRFDAESVHCSVTARLRIWNTQLAESWTTISVDNTSLSLSGMVEFRNRLDEWLHSPSVGVTAFAGHFQLGRGPSCRFDLHFGPRADTIASADKPVVAVDLSLGTTLVAFRFVTDQSCLGLVAMAMSDWETEQSDADEALDRPF